MNLTIEEKEIILEMLLELKIIYEKTYEGRMDATTISRLRKILYYADVTKLNWEKIKATEFDELLLIQSLESKKFIEIANRILEKH